KAKEIIRAYYDAWLKSDRDSARAFLKDDFKLRSPNDNFDSADAFFDACWRFAADFNEMHMLQEVYEDDAAFIAYTFGDFPVAEFHKIRDGKIAEVFVTFNPTV
ncbi:MAG: nuclear transport factor 2 family protein, partial [Hyphococcus sp.]